MRRKGSPIRNRFKAFGFRGIILTMALIQVFFFSDLIEAQETTEKHSKAAGSNITQGDSSARSRFVDNGDGTVTDQRTGLMWLKSGRPTFGAMPWNKAVSYCSNLDQAGYKDWYLPSKKEWETLLSSSQQNPAITRPNPFKDVVTYLNYWTRTGFDFTPNYNWSVNLYYGKGTLMSKNKPAFAWPVRKGIKPAAKSGSQKTKKIKGAIAEDVYLKEQIESKYTVIRYNRTADLVTLNQRCIITTTATGMPYSYTPKGASGVQGRVSHKMDTLYHSVQLILDMRKRMEKTVIELYPTQTLLASAYKSLLKPTQKSARVLYIFTRNTIAISLDSLNTRILAHYMALSIIDHFMPVRPPRKSAQIMASYVNQQMAR